MSDQACTTPAATRYAELVELGNVSRAAPKVVQETPSAIG